MAQLTSVVQVLVIRTSAPVYRLAKFCANGWAIALRSKKGAELYHFCMWYAGFGGEFEPVSV